MAEYSEVFTSKLDWAMPFQRTGKFPLDRSSMFSSYGDALKYAQQTGDDSRALGGTSYVGQIVVVYGTGSDGTSQEVAAYIITAVGEGAALQKLAQTTASGDFAADIAALQSSLSALDARITTLENAEKVVDTNTTYTFATGDTTEGSIRITDSTGGTQEVAIKGYDTLKALATGRTSAYVYANKQDEEYLRDIKNPSKYKKGDIIYFTATGIADEWVTGVLDTADADGCYYTFSDLEVEHPDLTQYLKSSEAANTYATKIDLNDKANNSTVTELDGKVTTLEGTVSSNKTELEGKIQKVADDLVDIDVTSQITTEINKLDMAQAVGNTNGNYYIKYINQTDGVVVAEAEAMPDVAGIAEQKASAAQSAAEENAADYTDSKIGDIGDNETAVQYIDAKVAVVDNAINGTGGIASRVQILENKNLDSRLTAAEEQVATNKSDISGLASRVSATEAVANDVQNRVATLETTVEDHTTQISNLSTNVASRVKTIQINGVTQTMSEDGTVNITEITTDILKTGSKTLVLDCLNASLTDKA